VEGSWMEAMGKLINVVEANVGSVLVLELYYVY
jgi:hypothetical protein